MRFADPGILWLLLLLPVLGLGALAAAALRRRKLQRFAGGAENVVRFASVVSRNRRAAKTLLLLLAVGSALIAVARPQWGSRLEPITRRGVDVVLVMDTSRSMAAEDVAPNRISQARHAASSLVRRLAGDRIALVTFAGNGSLTCPLTLDSEAVLLFLDAVDVDLLPVQGSSIGESLRVAARAFGPAGSEGHHRAVVVWSDGEDHEGGIDPAIALLRESGAAAYTIGCGTAHGGPIPLRSGAGAVDGYKKDAEGKVVTTRLQEEVLEKLALETGGHYYRATPSELEVEEIAKAIAGLDQKEHGTVLRTRYEERYQIPLAAALLALLAETLLGDRRRLPSPERERQEASS